MKSLVVNFHKLANSILVVQITHMSKDLYSLPSITHGNVSIKVNIGPQIEASSSLKYTFYLRGSNMHAHFHPTVVAFKNDDHRDNFIKEAEAALRKFVKQNDPNVAKNNDVVTVEI